MLSSLVSRALRLGAGSLVAKSASTLHALPASAVLRPFVTTAARSDLMDFFDKEENWGADKVRVGREWRKDELRLKSNQDLHKLWFVLLKERNMLLTMEHAYRQAVASMPNQERIDKVDMSMENLEEVVRERNRAYFELEVNCDPPRVLS